MQINQVSQNFIYPQMKPARRSENNMSNVSFGAANPKAESKLFAPFSKFYANQIERLAHGIGKVLDTKLAYTVIQKTKKSKQLFNHLMTTGSVVLSTLYVTQTLTNKKLDEKKRNTLAINQGIVFGLSTAMCYTTDSALNSWMGKFAKKYEAVNYKALSGDPKKLARLNDCVKGVKIAGKVMIFDSIYRFIAPVFVTPIANNLGNKYNASKK